MGDDDGGEAESGSISSCGCGSAAADPATAAAADDVVATASNILGVLGN
jgi:hypothetical protein